VAAPFAAAQHDVVGDQVERLLVLALRVHGAGGAACAGERPARDCARDVLARGLYVVDQRDQLGATLELALLLDDELRQRGAAIEHGLAPLE
jgi:hypothetical protein